MGRNNNDFYGAISGDFNEKHLNEKYDDEGRFNPNLVYSEKHGDYVHPEDAAEDLNARAEMDEGK